MNSIIEEILFEIFEFNSNEELIFTIQLINKRWCRISNSNECWMKRILKSNQNQYCYDNIIMFLKYKKNSEENKNKEWLSLIKKLTLQINQEGGSMEKLKKEKTEMEKEKILKEVILEEEIGEEEVEDDESVEVETVELEYGNFYFTKKLESGPLSYEFLNNEEDFIINQKEIKFLGKKNRFFDRKITTLKKINEKMDLFYFEIEIIDSISNTTSIGLVSKDYDKFSQPGNFLFEFLGWRKNSCGYFLKIKKDIMEMMVKFL
jgi:hypothetical protein